MRKFDNFRRALDNLKEIQNYQEPFDNVVLTGLVGLYEICFEQAWKAMKEAMADSGLEASETGSPRSIIKEAYQAGMVTEEKAWLEALVSRNHVTHAYNRDIALDIIRKTREEYLPLFEALKDTIQKNWCQDSETNQ